MTSVALAFDHPSRRRSVRSSSEPPAVVSTTSAEKPGGGDALALEFDGERAPHRRLGAHQCLKSTVCERIAELEVRHRRGDARRGRRTHTIAPCVFPIVAAVACLVLLAGCRDDDKGIPAACRQGTDTVRLALLQAPGEVRLEGTTPISDCINDTSSGGDMSDVGVALRRRRAAAGGRGGEAARTAPRRSGSATWSAPCERSRRGSQGVGYELGRRLEQEARAGSTPARRSTAAGLRAGRDSG